MSIKKYFNFLLMAAVALGFSMSVTSCKDDDDDKKNNEQEAQAEKKAMDPFEKNSEEGMALLNILGQLAGTDSLPDNWKTATFEPTVGVVLDESKPMVRTIPVVDVNEAASLFRSLTLSNNTGSWKLDGVGSMEYTALNQSDCYATIDVSIKQMPKLTQLRFAPSDAFGTNGVLGIGNYTFEGEPYYHIGDVVKDRDGRYWICVRSAWSGKKGDTHWISMQLLSKTSKVSGFKSNLESFKAKSERGLQIVPTKLGSSPDHMRHFAQLLAVLTTSEEVNLVKYFTGEGPLKNGLGDLGFDAHNTYYCQTLGKAWDLNNVWEKVLPGYIDDNGKMVKGEFTKQDFDADYKTKLSFFYNGYSSPGLSDNMKLFLARYGGTCFSEQELEVVQWIMTAGGKEKPYTFDIRDFALYGEAGDNTNIDIASKVQGRTTVPLCYTTGKGLANTWTEPDPTKKIEGVEDVFLGSQNIALEDKSEAVPTIGDVLCSNCKFYDNPEDARKAGATPVAIVIEILSKGTVNDGSGDYNALAMAIEDMPRTYQWSEKVYPKESGSCVQEDINATGLHDDTHGITFTSIYANKQCNKDHIHPAAVACSEYRKTVNMDLTTMKQKGFSDWFLPGDGQWRMLIDNKINQTKLEGDTYTGITVKQVNDYLSMFNAKPLSGIYWTSTRSAENYQNAVAISFEGNHPSFIENNKDCNKTASNKVRPFIAFVLKK